MDEEEKKVPTLQIKRDPFLKLWNSGISIFFFNKERIWNSNRRDFEFLWIPENNIIKNRLAETTEFAHVKNDIVMVYGKPSADLLTQNEIIEIEYEEFDPNNVVHVRSLFQLHCTQRCNQKDKYAIRNLLWFFNNYYINSDIIKEVLRDYNENSVRPFFIQDLIYYTTCLSLPKQKLIKNIVSEFGGVYNIFFPQVLSEALSKIYQNYNPQADWYSNIFELTTKAIQFNPNEPGLSDYEVTKDNQISNFFLKIRRWLLDEEYCYNDYEFLTQWLRLFTPELQFLLLKRYFLAIHKKQTNFQSEIIRNFKENQFDNWGINYHSLFMGSKPIQIGLQLITDNILTFVNSNGRSLQTINGTLDLAYAQSNESSPSINFELEKIVPRCNGGAVPNKEGFVGFICYKIVYTLKENIFNEESSLVDLAKKVIQTLSHHQYYESYCETYNKDFNNCSDFQSNPTSCIMNRCPRYRTYKVDKWYLKEPSEEKCKVVNLFLKSNFMIKGQDADIELKNISNNPSEIKQNIINFLNHNFTIVEKQNNFSRGYSYTTQTFYEYRLLAESLLSPSWIVIEPRNNAYIGLGILASKIGANIKDYGPLLEGTDSIKKKETEYLRPIILSSLREILNQTEDAEGKFYIAYDEKLLRKIQVQFYTYVSNQNGTGYKDRNLNFLKRRHSIYANYCAPEYSGGVNSAIKLPYFWCRGVECFLNNLSGQTLDTCMSWKDYTLLHMLEILGYPQIEKTDAGNEVSKLVRDFNGMVSRAEQQYGRVICRDCGHLLFSRDHGKDFNKYNNFHCENIICAQKGRNVYLSQCHHCKKGMIDSRDSKKCPNGWRICPICLSCCNDNQIVEQVQKYERSHKPLPWYVQNTIGKGHNNKEQYYCPNCGGRISKQFDQERQETFIMCESCRTYFPKAKDWI